MARNFSKDFKLHAVQLVLKKHIKIAQVARELDLNLQVLYRWVDEFKTFGEDAFVGKGYLTKEKREIAKLRKRLEELELENLILKKAQAYFAKIKNTD